MFETAPQLQPGDFFAPERTLEDAAVFLAEHDGYVILGTDSLAVRVKKVLEGFNRRVEGFVDLGSPEPLKILEGLPVHRLNHGRLPDRPAIIASYHQFEIAKILEHDHKRLCLRDYLFFDHLILAHWDMLRDSVGRLFYEYLADHHDEFQITRNLWADDLSRITFDKVIGYRLKYLDPEKMGIEDLPTPPFIQYAYERGAADFLALLPQGVPEARRGRIAFKISVNEYSYFDQVTPKGSRVILDLGAYDNTAAMFAYLAPQAKVYAFEPQPDMLAVNRELKKVFPNIQPVGLGVWSESGLLNFDLNSHEILGTAGAAYSPKAQSQIEVVSLDDFVKNEGIAPDFIKMDIEGAEFEALEGGRETIGRHGPDLAVAVYHSPADLHRIPQKIKELNSKYRFYFGHHNFSIAESVCFATTKNR